jgi:D-psicose/D-tagatose/L-ribulose 3-epimerase
LEDDMKVGVNLLLWTANPTFSEHGHLLDDLKGWGFDAFEIGVGGLSAADIGKFSKKAVELGLTVSALDVFLASDYDTISPDPDKRKKTAAHIRNCIDKAADIGARTFSGPLYQGLCNSTQTGPSGDEWKWAVDILRDCARFAKGKNIRIAAEPLNRFEAYLVNSMQQAYDFALDVGEDNFGILADSHHSNIEEYDVAASWAKAVDRIFNVHISENNRGIPGYGHAVPPAVFQALKKGGYDGNLIIEAFNANVPEIAGMLRLWRPFADKESIIAQEGLKFIKKYA